MDFNSICFINYFICVKLCLKLWDVIFFVMVLQVKVILQMCLVCPEKQFTKEKRQAPDRNVTRLVLGFFIFTFAF
jgi:hypothetical protein